MCYELVYYTHAKGKSYYQKASSPAKTDIDFTENAAIDRSNLLTFSDNSFIIFPPNVLHDERTERAASVFSVGFYADTETEKDLARFALKVFTDTDFFIWKYIKSLKIEFSEKKYGYKSMLDCFVTEMLISVFRRNNEKPNGFGIDYVVRYIDEYYMTDIDVDSLAQMSGYSPSRFRVLFKENMGLSPKSYILNKRLEHIKDDLRSTSAPLTQVAYENGFSDYYQFSAFFKKNVGVSPKEFRAGRE
ncbi:MAG: helix-turn-helix transcriptional regulator [Clostridia bacterium]|nr:helix-turn-helix transcriptional regulator [Clostridia bacterium]